MNAQKAREARAEQDRQLQAHRLSVQMQNTGLQLPVNTLDGNIDCNDTDDLEDIEMKMGMADEEIDAMLSGGIGKNECESCIDSGSENFCCDAPLMVEPDEV